MKLHFSTIINAPIKKVWDTMLQDETYRLWTDVFAPGSYFEGDWTEGSKMRFLGPDNNGLSGMVARIKENRPYEFISIEHLGEIKNGQELGSVEWSGAFENYTFREAGDNKTELLVDLETEGEMKEMENMFKDMWPKALEKLKKIAEEN